MNKENMTREEMIQEVTTIFIDVIGLFDEDEKKSINGNTTIVKVLDFKVDTDDLTEFIMYLEKFFKIKTNQENWDKIYRIYEVADLIIRKLEEKQFIKDNPSLAPPKLPPEKPASFLSKIIKYMRS